MDFNTYLENSWDEHAKDAKKVADSFSSGIKLITEASQIAPLASLVTHVMGEHLGKYQEGVDVLTKLDQLNFSNNESQSAITRSKAVLCYCEDSNFDLSGFSNSEQVRVLATVAGINFGQNQVQRSELSFKLALEKIEKLNKSDPANKALAIAGNNLASTLEKRPELQSHEIELMLLAARSARKYWEIAGTWLEIERAEYRLAHSYLKAKDYITSIKHANLCLTICEKNEAPALEFFFAYEAITLIEKATGQTLRSLPKMQQNFEKLSDEDKFWCEVTLKKI